MAEEKGSAIASGVCLIVLGIVLFFLGDCLAQQNVGKWFPSEQDQTMLTLGRILTWVGVAGALGGIALLIYGIAKLSGEGTDHPQPPVVVIRSSGTKGSKNGTSAIGFGRESQETARYWFCQDCGRENPVDALFCGDCGSKKR